MFLDSYEYDWTVTHIYKICFGFYELLMNIIKKRGIAYYVE